MKLGRGAAILAACLANCDSASAESPGNWRFDAQEIAADLEVGYAVAPADVDGDGRTDVVVVDAQRVVCYQNPDWSPQVLLSGTTRPHNVCIAPADVDGDGRIDFALGADWRPFDTETGGTIQWLSRPTDGEGEWQVHQIAEEPTVHRMRWADLDADGLAELIVVPLMGRGSTRPLWAENPVRVLAFRVPKSPAEDPWPLTVLNEELHVTHNFWPCDFDDDGRTDILIVSFEGVHVLRPSESGAWLAQQIGTGNQETSPNRGASEIRLGRLADGTLYIATIEPWHGFQVVVYTQPDGPPREHSANEPALWRRTVIDDRLTWGHAVVCADLDGDGDHELAIGVRDNTDAEALYGVRLYDPRGPEPRDWQRTLVDAGGVAVEDLAAADLDGDRRIDLVASGRQTHNVRIYWNRAP